MGCNISKEATAVVSPLHSPAAAQNTLPKQVIETPYVQEEKQEDPSIKQPINQSIAPIITSTPSQPAVSSSEPNTPDPASDAPAKPAKHHKHRREPSTAATSSKHNSPALLAVQAPRISTSLSNSTPGHHRERSQSVADALLGPSGNQLDTSKDQGMANQMKTRLAAEDTEKPARSRSAIETDNRGPDEPEASGDKHKKHREHKDKDKDKDKDKGSKEPKERKKKEKLIKTLELADLQHLSSTNLEALWKQYDKDKNGTLDRKELKRLAKDCIGRTIAMCENEIRVQQPKLSDQELKAAVEKELKFVLPGAAKENGKKEDVQKEMVRRLIRKLDVNGDGDVTKAELLATWNVFAKELFVMKAAEGPVGCSIM